MASEEQHERNEEFERRVLALIRDQLDYLDEIHPNGYDVREFVITASYWRAPEPDAEVKPWYGGPYPGWFRQNFTRGSANTFVVDEALLKEAIEHTQYWADPNVSDEDGDDETSEADDDQDSIRPDRLEVALDDDVAPLALTLDERSIILASLEDAPDGLAELRAVLLNEHQWR